MHWDRLLFSAKEAAHKAWFPLTRMPLGFEDVDITIDEIGAGLTARLLPPKSPHAASGIPSLLTGRRHCESGLPLTTFTRASPHVRSRRATRV
ncbi:4'-phosphopantetheinyl transferase superfamily protein [Streptomyces sp. MZ04]|uniref:4'-phosphopantetheinyl transferase superfamily protein n=1 Tax=Streptomyces sp. MZ04 TaxID=2559236 RepID=UPI0024766C27|nr:4'-phosphopantetheinyl transferase superfamily protein [Streptomyces sp. MZ04]